MKKLVIFLTVLLFGDVSDTLFKIKEIESLKKHFLHIDYNIFSADNIPVITGDLKEGINLKIYAVFNDMVNINGKWYKRGDEVNGYKILKISDSYVLLSKDGRMVTLKTGNRGNNYLKVVK